ncbi:YczE/YyaS/YitT family protein [Salirhabdus salicampi]|uniref:YczE/YyaS/YitT family protein n=1 Tax=Salirhabdus salicampi TaxID=476102 RepID=UPI0020C223B3|nr:YitT family protein [Salirhabdus salicampi]MCP8616969.1 YitT family protein [Salirhabdus salicampi]
METKGIQWCFFVVGLMILAFGIALTIEARELGISPWDVLHYGLYMNFGLTVGSWSIIVGMIIVTFTCIVTKSGPQIGTILNMVFIGLFIDLFLLLLPTPSSLWVMAPMFIIGVAFSALGIGVYVASGLGAGPRDGLMLYLTKKTGWKVQWVRNVIEVNILILGWMLGGPVGIGTLLIALLLGNFIGYSLPLTKNFMTFLINRGMNGENFYKG